MQRYVILTLWECTAWVRVIIMRIPPTRITKIYQQFCLKAQAFPSRNSFLVPDGVTCLALTTVALFLMLWHGNEPWDPSDRQKPGALCWAVGGRWPLERCGWLIGVVCVFITEVWGVILGVDWHVNIQTVQIYRWNVEGLAKGFFIRWWGLEWNVTKEILWCNIQYLKMYFNGELPDFRPVY